MESSVDGDCNIDLGLENQVKSGPNLNFDKPWDQSSKEISLREDVLHSHHDNIVEKIGSSAVGSSFSRENFCNSDSGSNSIQSKEHVSTVEDKMEGGDNDELGTIVSSDFCQNQYELSSMKETITEGEEYKLLSDISELVDDKSERNVGNSSDLGCDNSYSSEGFSNGSSQFTIAESISKPKILEENIKSSKQVDDQEEVETAFSPNIKSTELNNQNVSTERTPVDELIIDKTHISATTESALKKLASLGVIAEEKRISTVESKESVLHKLTTRGAISITDAGGFSLPSSPKTVTITPSQPKRVPGPKSAIKKQQAKKIKIDPGKSMDIDKDFSSLINFLSSGTETNSDLPSDAGLLVKHEDNLDSAKYLHKSADINLCLEQDTCNDRMDVDAAEDHSVHESDTESHDGNKSISQESDHAGEGDDNVVITSYKLKNVIGEGSAEILLSATKNVFYNKVQEFNRDMSIAALTVFSEMHQQDPRTRNKGKKRKAPEDIGDNPDKADDNIFEPGKKSENGITILEALSATGLRSIRYAREIPGVKEITANDLSEDAVETIKKNVEHNCVKDMVSTTMSDAALLMYQQHTSQQWYDAIDLDPYGCPSRFLDSAVQAVRDGGLLLVTCTDMAVLAGNSPETCYVKYGAVSIRSPACHEMALRIALQCIESHANRYGRYIVPLVSFSADFYIRLIVQIYTSPVTCKKTTSKLSMVYQCVGCQTHSFQPLGHMSQSGVNSQPKFSLPGGPPVDINCFHCNHKHLIGGPIWSAPIYSSKFVESMLKVVENGKFATSKRMQGMLEVIREELPDTPLYYTVAGLCSRLHCQAIPLIDIRSAILNTGYKVSSSHAAPTAIKTNAPTKIIWDIMRCWVHMNPVSQKRLLPGSVPAAIILEPPTLIANFDIHPKARPSSSMRKLLRYQHNPEKNWGPGMRARCNVSDKSASEKSKMNQNKNKTKSGQKNIDIIEVVTIDDEDEITEDSSANETPATVSASVS